MNVDLGRALSAGGGRSVAYAVSELRTLEVLEGGWDVERVAVDIDVGEGPSNAL